MRLEAVGKRYGIRQPWVVRGVTADLPAGRLIRVSGRNGSGKSTLLRVVAGVSLPSAGKVTGRPHTGYVPERFPGGLPFSGRESESLPLQGATGSRRSGLRSPRYATPGCMWTPTYGCPGPNARSATRAAPMTRREPDQWERSNGNPSRPAAWPRSRN